MKADHRAQPIGAIAELNLPREVVFIGIAIVVAAVMRS